jgi:hypothetical protein
VKKYSGPLALSTDLIAFDVRKDQVIVIPDASKSVMERPCSRQLPISAFRDASPGALPAVVRQTTD